MKHLIALHHLIFFSLLSVGSSTQELAQRPADQVSITVAPGKAPNSNAMYQQLRTAGLSGESSGVKDLVLQRDAAKFTFTSGSFYWLVPVNGKVTGAVFLGEGSIEMVPPGKPEKRSLSFLTKEEALHEDFTSAVFRFTDGTYEEIKKTACSTTGSSQGQGELNGVNDVLHHKYKFSDFRRGMEGYNLTGRILQDVLSLGPGRLFYAFIKGKKYNGQEVFAIDPYGLPDFHPEEVMFRTYDENKYGYWAVFHLQEEYSNGTATGTQQNSLFHMELQRLETQMEKSGKLDGDATSTFVSKVKGLRVVPLDLYPTLRVLSVTGQDGEALDFIQESKDDDPQFFVLLPKALDPGERYRIRTVYAGKDAVRDEGQDNYYLEARENWYPNSQFGDFAKYDMSFKVPKMLTLVATGTKTKDVREGDYALTQWKTEKPQTVAGFNVGRFKANQKKLDTMDFEIETYANYDMPDWLKGLSGNTTGMMDKAMAEADLSIKLYTDYFGPIPFNKIAMTQQTAGNYGQAWPELVYLPLTSFLDSYNRFKVMGFDPKGYFKVVAPHEVAHQWFGHTVRWNSYRDQWMSEGFSQLAASLFLQLIMKNPQEFINFWNDERKTLTEKNRYGFRSIDVGPLTMGYRVNNQKVGDNIYFSLIYPKGGYILHMVRMMMWNNQKGDENFKSFMHDFIATYTGKAASTEDFKAVLEKHMTKEMDLDGNHKMDWFFDEYVYGTALPSYHFEQGVNQGANGPVLNFKITQSGVDKDFKMLVPVYLEFANGKIMRLGAAAIIGNSTIDQSLPLTGVKDPPKRAILNYYDDVLGIMEK